LTFQIIQYIIILIVLVIVGRYVWGVIFDKHYQPVEWEHNRKQGLIHPELLRLEKRYPDKVRLFNWWFQIERLKKDGVPGDFAELGVYKGESAKIIHLMDPIRTFHLYDTFEGFKEEDLKGETGNAATYTTRNFADTSMEKVKRYLGDEEKFVFHLGRFPESVVSRQSSVVSQDTSNSSEEATPFFQNSEFRNQKSEIMFALVNMDADLYAPTKAGLEFFYIRLSPGGVIFIHDYNYKWPGIVKAVDEFVATIPETLILVPDMETTGMIVKH
jgi:O-methyltransferase